MHAVAHAVQVNVVLWHIRRDLISVVNNVIMTTVVGVGCEEPRAWKGLMVFRAL